MNKQLSQLVLTVLLALTAFGSPFWSNASTDIRQPEAVAANSPDTVFTQLQLTHTLFSALIFSYFKEGDSEYRPNYLGNKQYLLAFLNKWSEQIESQKFRSTKEIFKSIKNSKGYLAKYYSVWEGLYNPYAPLSVNLGYTQNGSLYSFLESESQPLEKRILRILDDVNTSISGSSHNYELAAVIAQAFLNSENDEIRNKANAIVTSKSLHQTVQILAFVRDFYIGVKGAGAGLAGVPKLQTLAQIGNPVSMSMAATRAIGVGAMSLASKVVVNPFISKIPRIHLTMAASGAAHLGLLFISSDDEPKQTASSENQRDPLILSFMLLWDNVESNYRARAQSIHSVKNLSAGFKAQSRDEIINRIVESLKSKTPIDYLDIFLKSEKLLGLDRRDSDDQLAMDFAYGKIRQNRMRIKKIYEKSRLESKQISQIRKILITEDLKQYKRDYPNLTSVYLGWGGNCVAQTMLMTGILKPLEDKIKNHAFLRLGVVAVPGHIETVLYDPYDIYFTISGKRIARGNRSVYKPEVLLLAVLSSLGVETNLTPNDFIDSRGRSSAEIPELRVTADNSDICCKSPEGLWLSTKKALGMKVEFVREGILERYMIPNNPGWEDYNYNPNVPESAKMKFSDFHFSEYAGNHYGDTLGDEEASASSGEDSGEDEDEDPETLAPKITILLDKSIDSVLGFEISQSYAQRSYQRYIKELTLTAIDERTFYHLQLLKRQSNGKYSRFSKLLAEFLKIKIREALSSEEFKELLIAPTLNINKILNFSVANISKARKYLSLLARRWDFANTHYYENGTSKDINLDFYVSNEDRQILLGYMQNYANLRNKLYASPAGFLNILNMANVDQRRFLMWTYSNDYRESLMETEGDLFDYLNRQVKLDKAQVAKLSGYLRLNVRLNSYLERLSTVSIDHSASRCSLLYANVQLPVAEESNGFLIHDPTQNISPECATELKNAGVQLASNDTTNEDLGSVAIESINFKPEVLIELTGLYGTGLHLWDEKLVNTFISNKYEIYYGKEYVAEVIKAILEHDTPRVITPAVRKLADHFNIPLNSK